MASNIAAFPCAPPQKWTFWTVAVKTRGIIHKCLLTVQDYPDSHLNIPGTFQSKLCMQLS